MNVSTLPISDPYAMLGLGPDAEDEQIRAAYLAKLKQFPPDRSPAEFEQVRDAYELLRDRRRRAQHTLFSVNPEARLESLVDGMDNDRRFVGPGPWLAVLKER
ncbi:MAG: J domain-containing protein [Acidobacteriaceae bacterium]